MEKHMITIDDKQYEEEDLSDAEKYMLAQIQDLEAKQYQLNFQKDQLEVAREAFFNALIQSIKKTEAERKKGYSGNVEG
jgi:hypothetical protein